MNCSYHIALYPCMRGTGPLYWVLVEWVCLLFSSLCTKMIFCPPIYTFWWPVCSRSSYREGPIRLSEYDPFWLVVSFGPLRNLKNLFISLQYSLQEFLTDSLNLLKGVGGIQFCSKTTFIDRFPTAKSKNRPKTSTIFHIDI